MKFIYELNKGDVLIEFDDLGICDGIQVYVETLDRYVDGEKILTDGEIVDFEAQGLKLWQGDPDVIAYNNGESLKWDRSDEL